MTNIDQTIPRKIITALIVSDDFAQGYFNIQKDNLLFDEIGLRIIEEWCSKFYFKYKSAPKDNIKSIYDIAITQKKIKPEELSMVEAILKKIASEENSTEIYDTNYMLDLAVEEMNRRKLIRLSQSIDEKGLINADRTAEIVQGFKKVERISETPSFSLLEDESVPDLVFEPDDEPLLISSNNVYLNDIIPHLTRKSFFIIRGRAKSMKTYNSIDLELRALQQKLNVCHFTLGDLSNSQLVRRMFSMMTGKQTKASGKIYRKPQIDCLLNQYNNCQNINRTCNCSFLDNFGKPNKHYKACTYCKTQGLPTPICTTYTEHVQDRVMTKEDVQKYQKMLKEYSGNIRFDIVPSPAGKLSATMIFDYLKNKLDCENITYDIVVVDHWGQLAPEKGTERSPIYEKVEAQAQVLRNIGLQFNCAVIVNDQASGRNIDGSSVESGYISEDSYSGGVAKNQYATYVLTLNRSKDDKKNSTSKIGVQFARNGSKFMGGGSYILLTHCLEEGQYVVDSVEVTEEDQEKIELVKLELGLNDIKKKSKSYK